MKLRLPILLLFVLLLFSCKEKTELTIELPSTPVLTVGSTWGVVTSNYLRMRAQPTEEAEVLDGLTRGTVVEVLEATDRPETVEGETGFWYRVNLEGLRGWAFGAYLETFDSRSGAEDLSEKLR